MKPKDRPTYEAPLAENVRIEARANGLLLLTLTTITGTAPEQAALKSVQHVLLSPDQAEGIATRLAAEATRAREAQKSER